MKKNKLILLLITVLALVFTLAACNGGAATTTEMADTTRVAATTTPLVITSSAPGTSSPLDGEDAMAAYAYISQTMNALGGYEATVVEDINYDFESTSVEMLVKVNTRNGQKAFVRTTIDDTGSTLDLTYVDGVAYCLVKSTGIEVKYKTQEDESVLSIVKELFDEQGDDSDKIASAAFGARENGSYTLNLTVTREAALETILKLYEGSTLDASAFSDIVETAVIECTSDGYVTKMTETVTYTVEGMACSIVSVATYHNVGSVPTISAPADAYNYVDADAMK